MGVVNLYGSRIMTGLTSGTAFALADPGEGGGDVKCWVETVEVGSADSATSTYRMARLNSNARLLGASRIFWDDLASSGSPTLDVGVTNTVVPTGATITADPDAINDGLDAAASGTPNVATLIKDPANIGKRLYEFVNGQTTDPKGQLDIIVTLADANVNVGGTITVEIYYTLD